MDFQKQIKDFVSFHQTTGWVIVLMVGAIAVHALLFILFSIAKSETGLLQAISYFSLPSSIEVFIYQPWSILTWPFACADSYFHANETGEPVFMGTGLWRYFIDGLILWGFGRIHQQLLGEQRTRRMMILAVPIIGLLTLVIGSLFLTKAGVSHQFLTGWTPLVVMLVVSCATLVPDYPVQLFLFGRVKILWVAVVLVLLEFFVAGFIYTPLGVSVALAALIGFGHVFLLKQGTDITESIWSYYQSEKVPEPKMKVKYGRTYRKEPEEKNQRSSNENVSQEEIDMILDKISDHGYESLSRREKEILFKASGQKDDENT